MMGVTTAWADRSPMVFTTTLLLIGLVVLLNVLAIWIRARLRRRFQGNTL